MSLKASLRSREYITLLNKFGESVNCHECLGIDAYWAEEIIERGDSYATISTNIVSGECAQATFDNAKKCFTTCYQYRCLSVLPQWRV